MTEHVHLKRHKRENILLGTMFLILLGMFAVTYFYLSSKPKVDEVAVQVVATSTPPIVDLGLSITPDKIQQGEPVLITINGIVSTSSVKSFTIDGRPIVIFLHNGQVTALLGIDLRTVPGTFPLVLTLKDGRQIKKDLIINKRNVVKEPFGIPEKLGGNTLESEKELISTLAKEAKIVNAVPTGKEKLWTEKFRLPLDGPIVVTSIYGYTRLTGSSILSHKGTDFEAPIGTPVYASNRGMVRFTDNLRNYGNTIIIDHGLGLQTVYMHLSEIKVTNGQMVERGEIIGLSGDTGYVLGPHLHFTVRVWDISIDPMKFMEILGSEN